MKHLFQEWGSSINLLTDTALQFPLHLHKSAELVLVKDGKLNLIFPDREFCLKKGDIAVIFPGQLHGYKTIRASAVSTVIFDPACVQEYLQELGTYRPRIPYLAAADVEQDIYFAFERLYQKNLEERSIEKSAWIRLIMAMVMPQLQLIKTDKNGESDLVYQIVEYLAAHYTEHISLNDLAKRLHVNKYYLSHAFSAKLHSSFSDYLNRLRCDHAKMLLSTTSDNIMTIGELSGFETQRTFNRVFKFYTGITPHEYRLTVRKR